MGSSGAEPASGLGVQRDTVRQIVVMVSAVVAVVGSVIGSGAAGGTPIASAAGGALSADATLIAPAGPAFGIWSIIYLGLVGYAVWQLLPGQRQDARQRVLGYPIALTLLLNAAWILSVQAGLLALSALVIVLLLASLVWAFALVLRTRLQRAGAGGSLSGAGSWAGAAAGSAVGSGGPGAGAATGFRERTGAAAVIETLLVDGTVGLYLGWVSIATAANLTSFLQTAGFSGAGLPATAWGVAIVAVAGLVGVLLAVWSAGRLSPALSLAWGLAWVAVSRVTGELPSTPVAIAAATAAAVVLVVTVIVRLRSAGHPATALDRGATA